MQNIAGNPREPLQLKSTTRGLFRWKQFGRAKGDFRYCKESSQEEFALRKYKTVEKLKDQPAPNFRIRKSYPQKSKIWNQSDS